jgi:cell wall-associated NlpC family hydrolase
VRFRAVGSVVFCMLFMGAPVAAFAAKGGVSPGGTSPNVSLGGASPLAKAPTAKAPTTKAPTALKRHTAPVTSKSASILDYKGPVYEKTATGQMVPYVAPQTPRQLASATGGSVVGVAADTKPELLVPGHTARVIDGLAAAPISAPRSVQDIIWTSNQIIGLPYIFGGGHASFSSPGYDCSGTVSFALHGASLISTPMDSSEFMGWESRGVGTWVTVFANGGHAYMTVAGLRLDTSGADDPSNQQGPRWRPLRPANEGFTVRHPTSL